MKTYHAEDFNYYFQADPRELSIYDSLSWSDTFGHTVDGQGGIVLRTLTEEVRRLNKVIHARAIQDKADIATEQAASGVSCLANTELAD